MVDGLCVQWGVVFEAYVLQIFAASSHGVNRYMSTTQKLHNDTDAPGHMAPLRCKRKRGEPVNAMMSQTLKLELKALLSCESYTGSAMALAEDRRRIVDTPALKAWAEQLSNMDVGKDTPALVPLVYSEHDDSQLVFGRRAALSNVVIPLCCYGVECVAHKVLGVSGPLGIFMTPSEQRAVDEVIVPEFESDAACLLCIRHLHTAMQDIRGALLLNPIAELGRAQLSIPPFQNIVAQPGGYKASAMTITPSSRISLGIHMVGATGALRLVRNPLTGKEFIDQEALKHGVDFQGGTSA
jgi:hypothetical protein